jgi:ribosome-associated toxin RatA of RatAB toxin-antitoxin module
MKVIQTKECITLPISADVLYDTIIDITKYYLWWPSKIELNVLNITPDFIQSELEVKPPTMGTNFSVRIIETVPNQKIVFQYFEGIQQGTGTWTFTPINNTETTLCYEVDVTAKGLLINLFPTEELIRIQQKFIQDLFIGLKKHFQV